MLHFVPLFAMAACMDFDEADCLDCMMMAGDCMSMTGAEGCANRTSSDCLDCHWMSNRCMTVATPAPTKSCTSFDKANCADCMMMGGKCMSMSGNTVCDGRAADECLGCQWENNMCMPVAAPTPVPTKNCMSFDKANCADCMMMGGKCMSMSGNTVCDGRAADECVECHWENNMCMPVATPAPVPTKSCMTFDKADCADCMIMGGKCMSMSGNTVCDGRAADECVECRWEDNMCMPVATPPSPSAGGGGQMVMTFYQGVNVVILFNEWSVDSTGVYVVAVLLTAVFAFASAMLREFISSQYAVKKLPLLARLVLFFIFTACSYLAMLITMTYNTGLFFAVVIGLTAAWTINEWRRLQRVAQLHRVPYEKL